MFLDPRVRARTMVACACVMAACHFPSSRDLGDDGHAALVRAARRGDADEVARLATAGADLDALDPGWNHWTPLQHAVHTRHPVVVRVLLDWGAQPDIRTQDNPSALFMAADDEDPTMLKMLLGAGADPRIAGPGGRTPLTQAVSGGALWDVTDRPIFGGCRTANVRELLHADPTLPTRRSKALSIAIWWARVHDCDEVLALVGTWTRHTTADKIVTFGGFMKDTFDVPSLKDLRQRRRATRDRSQP